MPTQTKLKSKGRKIGRNARFCERYRIENRRERNKIVNLKRHISRKAKEIIHKAMKGRIIKPDSQAINTLKRLT